MMNKTTIKLKINSLLRAYFALEEKENKFIPGKSKVRYAGAYYKSEELISMSNAMLSGWFGLGIEGEKLETMLTHYIKSHSTLLTNSGSSATLLTMAALTSDLYADRIPKGSEVITPACTFATTAAAIVHQGLIPVFVDIDVATFNTNARLIEKAISKKTSALLLPHTLGNPCDMDKIMKLVRKYKLKLVEDNCDALGSEFNGKKTGSFGELATCSFYPAHHITLAGEGGAVFINDPRLTRVVLTYRNWGRGCWCTSLEKDPLGACHNRFNFKIDGIPVDHKYYFLALGYNLKPVEIQAAMGVVQLRRFPQMAAKRRNNFKELYSFFKDFQKFFVLPESPLKANPCWFSFPLTVRPDAPFNRSTITRFLEDSLIETRTVFAGNIVRQPALKRVNFRVSGTLNNADNILKNTFFVGLGPHINRVKLAYMKSVFSKFLGKY